MAQYLEEERHMREENLRLQRKLQREMERREALCRQLSESESSLEMDDERFVLLHIWVLESESQPSQSWVDIKACWAEDRPKSFLPLHTPSFMSRMIAFTISVKCQPTV